MFVVFEGIDGSGKTTISNRVAAELAKEGLSVKHLRADGRFVSAVSEGIREFGRNAQNLDLAWPAEFLLYVARDVQLIHEALRPALAEHDLVLADRFLYTPEVLGRYGRRLPETFVRPILTAAADGIEPDLVILVDVDATFARARRKLRKLGEIKTKPPSRKGLSGVGLQQRLRRGYLAMADADPARWVVLENQSSLDASVRRAVDLIRQAHAEGAPRAIARYHAEQAPKPSRLSPLTGTAAALEAFLKLVSELSEREPRVAAYMLGGLYGARIDDHRRLLLARVPDAVLGALDGLTDEESFRIRRALLAEHPALVLRSLGSALSTTPGQQLWQELEALAPAEALGCLTGLEDEPSWQARERWFEREPKLRELIVGTLSGVNAERAWSLRERLLAERGPNLSVSYELSRSLAKSVTGLGSERAWRLRRESRTLAPVAAITSLGNLDDEESWRWRAEALTKAPKVVMSTLKGCVAAQAWHMRQQVVLDCKEALEGFQGFDHEEAWALRDASQDVWASTVVKTLGCLADAERGRAVVARQLAVYPENVSLLKHASAIALGLHRVASAQP